jgi:hypothetical protein
MKSEFDQCIEPYMTGCLEVALGSVDYAMEEAKAAEMARVEAEKAKAEKEAALRAKVKAEELEKSKAKAAEQAKTDAIEKANLEEALTKEAAEKTEKDATSEVGHILDQNQVDNPTSSLQTESDPFDDDDDMYGSD